MTYECVCVRVCLGVSVCVCVCVGVRVTKCVRGIERGVVLEEERRGEEGREGWRDGGMEGRDGGEGGDRKGGASCILWRLAPVSATE